MRVPDIFVANDDFHAASYSAGNGHADLPGSRQYHDFFG